MALLVEALNILLNGIWYLLEVGAIRQNLHNIDSIAVPKGMILTNFSKIQGWRNTFNFKLSIKERLPSKIFAILRFDVAVQPIKDVFGRESFVVVKQDGNPSNGKLCSGQSRLRTIK